LGEQAGARLANLLLGGGDSKLLAGQVVALL